MCPEDEAVEEKLLRHSDSLHPRTGGGTFESRGEEFKRGRYSTRGRREDREVFCSSYHIHFLATLFCCFLRGGHFFMMREDYLIREGLWLVCIKCYA